MERAFSRCAKAAVMLADLEAKKCGRDSPNTGDLLIGLRECGDGQISRMLQKANLWDADGIRQHPKNDPAQEPQTMYSTVLARAESNAEQTGVANEKTGLPEVSTVCLLWAITCENCIGRCILGVFNEGIRIQLRALRNPKPKQTARSESELATA